MTEISGNEYMEDSKGRLVPINIVSEIDQLRDSLVKDLVDAGKKLQWRMQQFKDKALGDVGAFVALSAEKYDVKMGGRKGNISLVSFDGRLKVQVAIQEHLTFDERLQAAKVLIDECLKTWTRGSRDELKTLVDNVFQVDKEGRINTARVLSLRRYEISDERWLKAMQAISDSLQIVGSKTYLRVYERTDQDGPWKAIALDLAAI